ncbi:MAG: InlB B-repeat-containing protein, partial [Thermoplasmata archaeon]
MELLASDPVEFQNVFGNVVPQLQPGDTIDLYDYSHRALGTSTSHLNQEGAQFRSVLPAGVGLDANTGLIPNVQSLSNGISGDFSSIAATYEPAGATAPGTYDFSVCLSYFGSLAQIDSAGGLSSVAYPTGDPLLAPGLQTYGWNYGEIAQVTDQVWVETQQYAMEAVVDPSVWTTALSTLIAQFHGAGEPLSKLAVQVSLGNDNHGTGTDPATALVAIETAVAMGISNIYIWTAQGYESYLLTLLSNLHRGGGVDGVRSGSTSTLAFTEPDGVYGYSVLSPTAAVNGARYVATPSTGSVDVNGANVTETVTYAAQYHLATTVVGEGTVSPAQGWYAAGHGATMLATPGSGYAFAGWTGEGSGSYSGGANPASVTLNGPVNETADFAPSSGNFVNFTETGLPVGTLWNVSLNGVSGSSSTPTVAFPVTSGSYPYEVESPVAGTNSSTRYVAAVTTGTVEVGTSSVRVTVAYGTEYELTVEVSPVGSGAVNPAGGWYAAATEVVLSASPATGYSVLWSGSGSGSYNGPQNPVTVEVTGPIVEMATFVPAVPAPSAPPPSTTPTPPSVGENAVGGGGGVWPGPTVAAILFASVVGLVVIGMNMT